MTGKRGTMPSALATVTTLPFRAISAARGARAVHPQGFVCRGRWTVERASPLAPDATVLRPGASYDVLARVSRGAGLPSAVGDFYGIAVRLLDAHGPGRHQDVLANASADLPLVHHVFLPAPRWYAQAYSTCLPYDAGAGPIVLGWLPPDRRGPGPSLDAMRDEVRRGAGFGIAVAALLGRFTEVGRLVLDGLVDPGDGDVDFDPTRFTGGGLRPVGLLNRLRGPAYANSRRGRGAPRVPRALPAPPHD
ncbi:MAG: hypothetical protein JWO90_2455 [Solirubrobacterales bacterium]|nr:hypothetical protein [Solirubrobacterales bacterium]